jgi:hypothetical protein
MTNRIRRCAALLLGAALLIYAGWVAADPPARVARLGYTQGAVSFAPAGEDQWVLATLNRPLVTGDRLWVDTGARSEVQVGNAIVRLGGDTSLTLLNLDDRVAQLQLAQGSATLRIRRLQQGDVFEIDTPNLAFTVRRAGDYRIDVDPSGNTTAVLVRSGEGEVYGEGGAAYVVDAQHSYRFAGTGLRDYEQIGIPPADDFDRWASDRERRTETSASARYVSPDVIGYEDLDANGTWRAEAEYGNVWVPKQVPSGWSPYHDGHWAWIDPWGWTWVDDAPWGFAVTHYGRWAHLRGSWCWVPGPVGVSAVYAPALVAFVGGPNFQLSISSGGVGGIAWFPLGPREVYRPSYAVSRTYFERVNVTNTVVNTTTITNVYNNNVTNVVYANQRVEGAVVAVPTTAFAQSQPIARAAVRVAPQQFANATVFPVAAVAPVRASVLGAAQPVERKPPAANTARPVVVRNVPPAPPPNFAAQQNQLAAKPGVPLDNNARQALKAPAATAAQQSPMRVVAPTATSAPTKAPPAVAAGRIAPPSEKNAPAARNDKGTEAPATKGSEALATKGSEAPPTFARPQPGMATPPPAPPVASGKSQEPVTYQPPASATAPRPPITAPAEAREQGAKGPPPTAPRPPTEARAPSESRPQSALAPLPAVPRPVVTVPPAEARAPAQLREQAAKAPPPAEARGAAESRARSFPRAPEQRAPEARVNSAMTPPQSNVQPAPRAAPERAPAAKAPAPPPAPAAAQPPERSADARRAAPPPPPANTARSAGKGQEEKGAKQQSKQDEERNRGAQ